MWPKLLFKLSLFLICIFTIASIGPWSFSYRTGQEISIFDLYYAWESRWWNYKVYDILWSHIVATIVIILIAAGKYRNVLLKYLLPAVLAYIAASIAVWINYPQDFGMVTALIRIWGNFSFGLKGINIPQSIFQISILSALSLLFYYCNYCGLFRITDKYGYAKWATIKDLKIMGLSKTPGIVLGKISSDLICLREPLSVLVFAPPGTGKTSGIAIPTLLYAQHSFIINDPKGEIYETTADKRKDFSRIILLDLATEGDVVFNPLDFSMLPSNESARRAYITNIAEILMPVPQNDKNYFELAARNTFTFFAEWMVWHAEKNGTITSIPEIASKVVSETDIIKLIHTMIETEGLPQYIKEDGVSTLIASQSKEQFAGVTGTMSAGMDLYRDPLITKALRGKSTFIPDDFRKESTTLYIKIRDEDRYRLAPVVKLIMSILNNNLLSELPCKDAQSVTFMVDEFPRLGRLTTIIDLPALGRGYRVNAIFIAQDMNQIKKTYSAEDIKILFSTCAYKVIFQQGEIDTAKAISELIGKFTTERKSINMDKKLIQSQRSESVSEEGLYLVTPQDILNLNKDKCLILAQGYASKPLKADIAFWFKGVVSEKGK